MRARGSQIVGHVPQLRPRICIIFILLFLMLSYGNTAQIVVGQVIGVMLMMSADVNIYEMMVDYDLNSLGPVFSTTGDKNVLLSSSRPRLLVK